MVNDSSSLLEDVSIIILSRGRQDFLRRQLLYYSDFPVAVIIADGSESSWPEGRTGTAGEASWEYFSMPGLETYFQRLLEALKRVKTTFVTFADDQDGHLCTGIRNAAEALNADMTIGLAGGTIASCLDPNSATTLVRWGYLSDSVDLAGLSGVERLEKIWASDRTGNFCYQVYRTNDLRGLLSHLPESTNIYLNQDWTFIETVYALFFSLLGTFVMLDVPYWVRSGDSLKLPDKYSSADPETVETLVSYVLNLSELSQSLGSLHPVELDSVRAEVLTILKAERVAPRGLVERTKRLVVNFSSFGRALSFLSRLLRIWSITTSVTLRFNWNLGIPFSDFGYVRAAASPDAVRDVHRLSQIWNKFPDGITDQTFARMEFKRGS